MPTSTETLARLAAIAHALIPLAALWHVVLLIACVAMFGGWRPTRRVAAHLVAVPLGSVAALAFAFRLPFNGVVFAAAALWLLVGVRTAAHRSIVRRPPWALTLGCIVVTLVAFAVSVTDRRAP